MLVVLVLYGSEERSRPSMLFWVERGGSQAGCDAVINTSPICPGPLTLSVCAIATTSEHCSPTIVRRNYRNVLFSSVFPYTAFKVTRRPWLIRRSPL